MKLTALKWFNSQVYIPQWHITYRVFLCFREIIKCLSIPYLIASVVFTFSESHIIYWYFHVIYLFSKVRQRYRHPTHPLHFLHVADRLLNNLPIIGKHIANRRNP